MTTPLRIKIKKNEKIPQIFTQGTSVQNFSWIGIFLKSQACPKVFGLVLRLKLITTPPRVNISIKSKKFLSDIHPKEQVCKISAKSDHFWSLQPASKLLALFELKLLIMPLKIKNLKKGKKKTKKPRAPRDSPKELVCKISAESDHFWWLQPAHCPKQSLAVTDWQTARTYWQTFSDSSSTEVENIICCRLVKLVNQLVKV